ncbi:MAG: hypothetical protein J6B87_07555 [Clostridia bacterium]|nr:hypothetical protein [Clostridia bacterium]
MKMIPVNVTIKNNDIIFRTGDDKVAYKSDINSFIADSGVTIKKIVFPIESSKVYYLPLGSLNKTFVCGNLFSNIMLELEKVEEKNRIVIIDFDGVDEVSAAFLSTYTKFLLETSDKVITINMNMAISNDFGSYVISNIKRKQNELCCFK